MKNTMLKKTAISSLALLMLAGGATSAFADGGRDRGHDGGRDDNNDRQEDKHDKDDDKYKVTWQFEDEDDLKWAMEYIMRLASKGVFTGYEDGTFKPHQKISRIETLTAAVRLMGLRAQAESSAEMNTDLQFKDAEKIEKKYPWAVGYVAVALENDLFSETETEVKPEANATRLWSTILLVKALKLEDEAKALNNTKLDFKDAKEIPAGSVGYVALALQKGIITGYNDKHGKTFRPNQPVTRAELAALLDRTDTEMPDQDAQAITGKLKAAPADGKLTVVKADNTEASLAIDSNVFIFRDDKKAPLSALRAGDEVLVRTYQNKVVFIEVTKSAPVVTAFSELGILNTLTFNAQAKLVTLSISRVENSQTVMLTFNVDANVAITGDASLLKPGQLVQVKGENGTAKTIEIK
ncbi:S-layer homology domain-containing protein [Paenibacillus sp. LHD-38]|uniref:S-layer homology domain-containing protein n=1 Tax=Paenibacillus sp. LHD-38 TaxID=3072143 RepID=UPI00280F3BD9|nr:S-layer homology domain-containing protein [Paenibacillus sp. LHD-38]MDQ8739367.1 S-layer homology domain-containing protein [Paenibacillus sp. LHD-38]